MDQTPTANPVVRSLSWMVLAVFAANAILIASAKIQVPFYPVPMTMQTLAVVTIGWLLGPRLAVIAVAAYLVEGASGLPVFAGSRAVGMAYILGPTGGFLVGFLAAAYLVGIAVEKGLGRSIVAAFLIAVAAHGVTYLLGLAWLRSYLGFGPGLFRAGLIPFLPGDVLKCAIAALALPSLRSALNRPR